MATLLLHERYDRRTVLPSTELLSLTLLRPCVVSRSVLVPNDAQCWRRLATLYGENGQEVLAHKAHYNAWQLGIGQGGFGGPR